MFLRNNMWIESYGMYIKLNTAKMYTTENTQKYTVWNSLKLTNRCRPAEDNAYKRMMSSTEFLENKRADAINCYNYELPGQMLVSKQYFSLFVFSWQLRMQSIFFILPTELSALQCLKTEHFLFIFSFLSYIDFSSCAWNTAENLHAFVSLNAQITSSSIDAQGSSTIQVVHLNAWCWPLLRYALYLFHKSKRSNTHSMCPEGSFFVSIYYCENFNTNG